MQFIPYDAQRKFCNSISSRIWLCGDTFTGNTTAGAYAITRHLTGEYPEWWKGHIYTAPITAAIFSENALVCRDVIQPKLLSFMDPLTILYRPGLPGAIQSLVAENGSILYFFSSEQCDEMFQGFSLEYLWADSAPLGIDHPLRRRSRIITFTGSPV